MEQKQQSNTYNKRHFIIFFCITIGIAAGARHLFSINVPISHTPPATQQATASTGNHSHNTHAHADTTIYDEIEVDEMEEEERKTSSQPDDSATENQQDDDSADGTTTATDLSSPRQKNKIKGVWSYKDCFPDLQDTQLEAAQRHGITPVSNREEAERLVKKHQLVNITHSPYYVVDDLTHSIPYLVPRAQHLLNTISINFIDSCYAKGVPTHLLMVTSVLRTTDDVSNLQRGNKNATTNSCHCYGTTIDIAYNRFMPLGTGYDPDAALLRWDEPMKRILSEVLFDLRVKGKCYVKYERKQGCFHLTCR